MTRSRSTCRHGRPGVGQVRAGPEATPGPRPWYCRGAYHISAHNAGRLLTAHGPPRTDRMRLRTLTPDTSGTVALRSSGESPGLAGQPAAGAPARGPGQPVRSGTLDAPNRARAVSSGSAGRWTASCATCCGVGRRLAVEQPVAADLYKRARARGHDPPPRRARPRRAWGYVIWRGWQDGIANEPSKQRNPAPVADC
jgi:hypothetical protein